MDTIREQVRLIYDLVTFNFEIEEPSETGEILLEREELGATLPAELFPRILFWLNHHDTRSQMQKRYNKDFSKLSKADRLNIDFKLKMANPLFALRNCALVSRYWANLCRAYMFTGKALQFDSLEEARIFRHYMTQGSKNLIPLYELIGELSVWQDYTKLQRSFLDLVYTAHLRGKLKQLRITGPLPYHPSPLKFDSPHLGIANTVLLPPPITAYHTVLLDQLRFPSLSCAMRYLGYFRGASNISMDCMDWDKNDLPSGSLPLLRPKPIPSRKRLKISAGGGTDDLLLVWLFTTAYSDSPIHNIVGRDQHWMLHVVNFIYEYCRKLDAKHASDNGHRLAYTISQGVRGNDGPLEFVLDVEGHTNMTLSLIYDSQPRSPGTPNTTSRGSPKPMRIMAAVIQAYRLESKSSKAGHDVTALSDRLTPGHDCEIFAYLRRQLEELCMLRYVVVIFPNYQTLQRITKEVESLREPWESVTCVYRFVCRHNDDDPFPTNPYHFNKGDPNSMKRWKNDFWEIIPTTFEITGNHAGFAADLVTGIISG